MIDEGPVIKLVLCVPVSREWAAFPPERVERIVRELLRESFSNAMRDFDLSKHMRWL